MNYEKHKVQEAGQDIQTSPSPDFDEKIDLQEASPCSVSPSIVQSAENVDEREHDVEVARATTTASSIIPAPVKVPRSKRRGLFGRFSILAEVEEPKHYSRRTKWYITFVIAMAAVAAPLGSAIILRTNCLYLQAH